MRLFILVAVGCALACGPGTPGGSDGAGGTSGVMESGEAATGAGSSSSGDDPTTAGGSTGAAEDPLAEHMPCPNGDECSTCVQSEGASICGPECYEYGPGFARCQESAFKDQMACPWGVDDKAGVCLILCGDASHCPDPGMVCVACPEHYKMACDAFWMVAETGPNICAWPAG
jgi:hypothetical protein